MASENETFPDQMDQEEQENREHWSRVLRSMAASLQLLNYSLEDLPRGFEIDGETYKRLRDLCKDIEANSIEALTFADELAPDAGLWGFKGWAQPVA